MGKRLTNTTVAQGEVICFEQPLAVIHQSCILRVSRARA
jgi:hypothetical protein